MESRADTFPSVVVGISISGISIYGSLPLPIASANLQAMSPLDMHNASLLKHTLPLYSFVSNAFLNAVLIHQDVYILGMTKKPLLFYPSHCI